MRRGLPRFLVLFVLAACDGDFAGMKPTAEPQGREPEAAGAPLPPCEDDGDCAPGSGCVSTGAVIGHCFPRGSGGGPCRTEGAPCDPGFACAGKTRSCVPVVPVGAGCTGAACAEGSACGLAGEALVCARPGTLGGACLAGAGARCEAGLGCTAAGRCAPVREDRVCSNGRRAWGCPDGLVCPRNPDAGDSVEASCVRPGTFGNPCLPGAPGTVRCEGELGCRERVCATFVFPVGTPCQPNTAHDRCEDGTTCRDEVCTADGSEGGRCRDRDVGPPCDSGLSCDLLRTCRPHVVAFEACEPGAPAMGGPMCEEGTACRSLGGSSHACLPDGSDGGVCRAAGVPCDEGLACGTPRGSVEQCLPGLPIGEVCTPATERAEPCVAGASCSLASGTCAPDGAIGSRCGPSFRCETGAFCDVFQGGVYCFPLPPAVAAGAACDARLRRYERTNRCPDSEVCLCGAGARCEIGTCRALGSESAPCRWNDRRGPCDAGLACQGEICRPGAAVGSSCLPGGVSECAAPALCLATAGNSEQGVCSMIGGYVESELPVGEAIPRACEADGKDVALLAVVAGAEPRDDGIGTVTLPFPFPFWGQTHTSLAVRPDGVVGFPRASDVFVPAGGGGPDGLPAPGDPGLIAAFWDDLHLGDAGKSRLCTRSLGDRFVVEWRGLHRFGRPSARLDVVLVLHASGTIDVFYPRLTSRDPADDPFVTGVRASIGLQAPAGLRAAVHDGRVRQGRGLRFAPVP